ncbi:hypothetical protein BJ986_001696 [Phycicoccus badiiscoriae]|uniref:VOC domain-containing protein n=1 Tax=Pedococcus badiiscoriae TaxID=642776 RepID=A0A852WEK2_9MICO|nr:VOC family protein [Pedococcus badiiscoriae]NYG07209.1 hypothetical protein [Pedococcus badiiscoriae]
MGAAFRIGSIVVNVSDVPGAMAFWSAALDYEPRDEPEHDPDPEPDWVVLRPRDGNGPNLSLNRGETQPSPIPHLHLDLYAHNQAAEVERLVGLGARRAEDWRYPDEDRDYEVLEDPDGNRFCVIDASAELSTEPGAEPGAGASPG